MPIFLLIRVQSVFHPWLLKLLVRLGDFRGFIVLRDYRWCAAPAQFSESYRFEPRLSSLSFSCEMWENDQSRLVDSE